MKFTDKVGVIKPMKDVSFKPGGLIKRSPKLTHNDDNNRNESVLLENPNIRRSSYNRGSVDHTIVP